uniref:Putative secreted protein n=1 Tax=Ixodes scapularis TaxID=6945 RepID=A0A4D5RFR6_IXOSC
MTHVLNGAKGYSFSFRVYLFLLAWATYGGFPLSHTKMEEVLFLFLTLWYYSSLESQCTSLNLLLGSLWAKVPSRFGSVFLVLEVSALLRYFRHFTRWSLTTTSWLCACSTCSRPCKASFPGLIVTPNGATKPATTTTWKIRRWNTPPTSRRQQSSTFKSTS